MAAEPSKAIEVYYSYARNSRDESLLEQLKKHLKILTRTGFITKLYDHNISAGIEWENENKRHLNTASIILLLVSSDFIDSDYCWGSEMTRAMERYEAQEARVIPIILRPIDWRNAPFGKLQPLPRN